ncbi:unnamed protein product [Lymnaea stagnalis]|uniref:GH10 domain-containing protein n=1 Tax=Lymnaea stagnalis TaxID=6523 RepID=A0AAV2IFJ2_LYMST
MLPLRVYVALASLCVWGVHGATELLQNPGFENGISNWLHDGFTMTADTSQKHGGTTSAKCTGRSQNWMGPAQMVTVKPGGRYAFSLWVRLISDLPGSMYQTAAVKINFKWKDTGADDYFPVTSRNFIRAADGWVQVGADFVVPNREYNSAKIYVEGFAANVDYYVDDATLTEIPENTNWKAEADQRIENLRKSNIQFNFNVASNLNKNDLKVQIDHTRHLFGFGSQMTADYIVSPDFRQFQNIAYYMFNWATIQEYKWPYNRGTRERPDFSVAIAATDELRKHGLNVRGHCMFWAVPGNQPSYVDPMTGQTLKDTVDEHIKYITGVTKGKLAHWDVDNELLHGHFFETKTGDPNYTHHMFQAVHAADPTPKLFLNDYNVVAFGESTYAYLSQINEFKAANVGLGAVGVQSHFPSYQAPDPTLMKNRLDLLAQPGLPIWITELDLSAHDENTRADWYETALRLYFSHPAVEGIIFWGFWDHDMDPAMALVHGNTFALDKAGERYLHLTKQEWSTHVNRSLTSGTSFNIRGFQGDYDIIVWYQNKPIKIQNFHVDKADTVVNVDVSGDGHAIQIPVKTDPFAPVAVAHTVVSTGLYTVGQATSTSSSHQLTCATRWSGVSEVGDDKTAEASCNDGEILTGCSSYLKNGDWHRDGEQIVMTNGKPACKASNGFRTTIGIQASARCCSLSGLTCTYKYAGQSGTGVDDQILVPCGNDGYPLGCGTYTYMSDSDGTYFTNTSCIGQNDGVTAGVYSSAACCKGGNIQCTTVYSTFSGHPVGARATVKCPAGQVMTGCNVFTPNAKGAGAFIETTNGVDQCVAVNGYERFGSEDGAQAIATCCHV